MKCSRSGRQPDQQQLSVGLAPPPSPSSMTAQPPAWRGEDNVIPRLTTTTTLHPTRRALPCDTGFSFPLQTLLASPAAHPGDSWTRRRNMRWPLSAPLGEVEASPRTPRHHSRGTTPAQLTLGQRAPTGSLAHQSKEFRRALRTRAPGLKRGREARKGCPKAPSISFQAGSPPTLPADPGASSETTQRPPIPKTQFPHT